MKKILGFDFLLVLLFSLTACGGQTEGETHYTITLEGNPTTGYEWSKESGDDALLVCGPEYTENEHEDGMVGVGGVYTYTVTAKKDSKPGEYHLSFTYCRPWDKMNTLSKIANVTLFVDDKGKLTGETNVMDLSEELDTEEEQNGIFIDYTPVSNTCYARDGALLYTAVYTMPVVTIPENSEAEEAINAWFVAAKEAFFASLSTYDTQAADAYALWKEQGRETWNNGLTQESPDPTGSNYYVKVTCTPTLNRDSYLSFRIDETSLFYGAPEESTDTTGVTFDRQKGGTVLTLFDLYSEDVVPFIENRMQEEMENPGTIPDGKWFLTEEGLVIIGDTGTETLIPHDTLSAFQH